MMRSLWTAASGMTGQQFNMDTISNNLSNVNTTGFKKVRAEFEDLLYQTMQWAGTPATEQSIRPLGIQVGNGTRVAATQRLFEQGSFQATGVNTDLALSGEGFFRVLNVDGSFLYTRDGSFKIDSEGQLVTNQGNKVYPEIIMPEGFVQESLSISNEGLVSVKVNGNNDPIEIGQLELYRFVNPAGLNAVGSNFFKVTQASGEAIGATPGQLGMGSINQGFLEMSNVSVVQEMVNMIVAQRAYEINSKAVQTSDSMLGIANNLKQR